MCWSSSSNGGGGGIIAGSFLAVLIVLGKPEEGGALLTTSCWDEGLLVSVSFPATFLLSCPVIFDGGGTMSKPDTSPRPIDCRFREGGGGGDDSFIFPEASSYLAYPPSKFDIVWRRLLGNIISGKDIILVGVLHLGGELSGGRGGEEAGDAWDGRLQVSKLWRRHMAGRGGGFLVALFSPPLFEVVMVLLCCDILQYVCDVVGCRKGVTSHRNKGDLTSKHVLVRVALNSSIHFLLLTSPFSNASLSSLVVLGTQSGASR